MNYELWGMMSPPTPKKKRKRNNSKPKKKVEMCKIVGGGKRLVDVKRSSNNPNRKVLCYEDQVNGMEYLIKGSGKGKDKKPARRVRVFGSAVLEYIPNKKIWKRIN